MNGKDYTIAKIGILFGVVTWLYMTVRSAALVERGFWGELLAYGSIDFWLRLVTLALFVGLAVYAQKAFGAAVEQRERAAGKLEALENVVEQANIPLALVNEEGRVELWNEGAQKLTGFRAEDMSRAVLVDTLMTDADAAQAAPLLTAAFSGEQAAEQVQIKARTGGRKTTILHVSRAAAWPAADGSDSEKRVLVGFASIDDWVKRVGELETRVAGFEKLIASAGLGMVVVDKENHPVVWNEAMEQITGLPSAELTDRPDWMASLSQHQSDLESAVSAVRDSGEPTTLELPVASQSGEQTPMLFRVLPYSSNGHVDTVCLLGQGVAGLRDEIERLERERTRLEESLEASQGQEQDLEQERERLLTEVEHLEEKCQHLETQCKQAQQEQQQQRQQHQEQLEAETAAVREAEQEKAGLQLEKQQAAAQTEQQRLEQLIQQLREQLDAAEQSGNEEREQLKQRLEAELADYKDRLQSLEEERQAAEEQTRTTAEALAAKNQELEEQLRHAEQLQRRQQELGAQLETRNEQLTGLKQKLTFFRRQLESAPLPLAVLNGEGVIQYANKTMAECLDRTAEALKDRPLSEVLPETDDGDALAAALTEAAAGERAGSCQLRLGRAGNRKTYLCSVAVERSEAVNGARSFYLVGQDISSQLTQIRELEQTLQASRQEIETLLMDIEGERDRLNGILEFVDQGIVITDPYHRVVLMNRAAEDQLQTRLSQVLDRPVNFLVPDVQFKDELERVVAQSLTDHRFELQLPGQAADQTEAFSVKTAVIRNKYRQDTGVLTVLESS